MMGAGFVTDPLPGLGHLVPDSISTTRHSVPLTDAVRLRFWRRTHITSGGCWIWTGAVGDDGYGRITWTHRSVSRTLSTHRFALHLAFGPVLPPGLVAAHGCDHPLCVRVGREHVHLSTQQSNLAHAVSVGRHEGTAVVVDSTQRRDASLKVRSTLTGSLEPPTFPTGTDHTLF